MKNIGILLFVLILTSFVGTSASTISATASGVIRMGDEQYTSSSLMVKIDPGYFEDRSILEFDISGISSDITKVMFDMWYYNLDYPAALDGIMDVYTYTGDGIVTTGDFSAGALFTSFIGKNDSTIELKTWWGEPYTEICGYANIDITSVVLNALAANQQYLGIRLSTTTSDRYNIGSMCGLPDPVLVVPEPVSAFLVIAGMGLFRLRNRKKN